MPADAAELPDICFADLHFRRLFGMLWHVPVKKSSLHIESS